MRLGENAWRESSAAWWWAGLTLALGLGSVVLRAGVPGVGTPWDPSTAARAGDDFAPFLDLLNAALPALMAASAALAVAALMRRTAGRRRRRRWDLSLVRSGGLAAGVVIHADFAGLTAHASAGGAETARALESRGLRAIAAIDGAREGLRSRPEAAYGGPLGEVAGLVAAFETESAALAALAGTPEAPRSAAPTEARTGAILDAARPFRVRPGSAASAGPGGASVPVSPAEVEAGERRWSRARAELEADLSERQRRAFADRTARSLDPSWRPGGILAAFRNAAAAADVAADPTRRACDRAAAVEAARSRLANADAALALAGADAVAEGEAAQATARAEGAEAMSAAIAHDRIRSNVRRPSQGGVDEPPLHQSAPEFLAASLLLGGLVLAGLGGLASVAISAFLSEVGAAWLGERNGPWAGALLGLLLATGAIVATALGLAWREGGRLADSALRTRRRGEAEELRRRLDRISLLGEDLDLAAVSRDRNSGRGDGARARAVVELEHVQLLRRIAAVEHLPGTDLVGEDVEADLAEVRERLGRIEAVAAERLGVPLGPESAPRG
ncbi:hypothetical protein [Galactobacter valiniphilus]|uniref:hypothetical protein n=1 Tax=Galactobacter valiniphilus TaxID=2676122 RepID=UPI003735BE63